MRSANRLSTSHIVTYCLAMFLGLASIGCSSKSDQENTKDDAAPSPATAEQRTQVSLTEQVNKLKQENEELKKTLAESLTLKEQVQKLRQENDELKRVATEASALTEKARPAEPERGVGKGGSRSS